MDSKKISVEKLKVLSIEFKQFLQNTIESAKSQENKLISQLAERLKLSERFVKTSKF